MSPWIKNVKPLNLNIVIDINFDILWGEYTGKRIDITEFLSDTIDLNIYGINIKTLNITKSIIQLALHQYKDVNSIFLLATRNSVKLDMFKDLFYLIKNNLKEIRIDDLLSKAIEYQIVPYMYYMFYHMNLLFNDSILETLIDIFKSQEGIELLNCYGLNDLERREWRYDFKTRLNSPSMYELIKDDLTENDLTKIEINRRAF